mgnify:CR=1 FL=1
MAPSSVVEHHQISWNGRGGLDNTRRISVAQVNCIAIPDWSCSVQGSEVALSQFDTLVMVAVGSIPSTGVSCALIGAVGFGCHSVERGHCSSAGRSVAARGQVVITNHFGINEQVCRVFWGFWSERLLAVSTEAVSNDGVEEERSTEKRKKTHFDHENNDDPTLRKTRRS